MAMPLMCRQARPFILSPFPFPEDYIASIDRLRDRVGRTPDVPKHIIHQALEWREMLRGDKTLSMATIAVNQGLSRARVTQIMSLLELPRRIVRTLQQATSQDEIRCYPERKLRQIFLLSSETEQLQEFAGIGRVETLGHPQHVLKDQLLFKEGHDKRAFGRSD